MSPTHLGPVPGNPDSLNNRNARTPTPSRKKWIEQDHVYLDYAPSKTPPLHMPKGSPEDPRSAGGKSGKSLKHSPYVVTPDSKRSRSSSENFLDEMMLTPNQKEIHTNKRSRVHAGVCWDTSSIPNTTFVPKFGGPTSASLTRLKHNVSARGSFDDGGNVSSSLTLSSTMEATTASSSSSTCEVILDLNVTHGQSHFKKVSKNNKETWRSDRHWAKVPAVLEAKPFSFVSFCWVKTRPTLAHWQWNRI